MVLMYRTLYTDLDLVSEEEFLVQHPEFSGLERHELMVKRLEDEAEQRVELETRRKDLVNRRTATQADSKKRKNDLDNLTETLKKFIEVVFMRSNEDFTNLNRVLHQDCTLD